MDYSHDAWKKITAGEAGIVLDWLLKVVIALVVVGLILFEVGAVILVKATAADTAAKAGEEGGFIYRGTSDLERAEQAAEEVANKGGAELVSFSVDPQNNTTTTTVTKKAKTIFIHKIGFLEKYSRTTATQEVPIPT